MNIRRCVFTWNNWEKDFKDKEAVNDYFKSLNHIKYFVIGFEVGEQGTPHLQGLLSFTQPKTFDTLRKYLKNNHIEQVKGTFTQAMEYCKKDGDFIEFGDAPIEQGKRNDIDDFIQAVEQGYSNSELLKTYPSQYLRYQKMIADIRENTIYEKYKNSPRLDIQVIYIHGSAGVGKTRYIYETHGYENVYRVSDYKNPFDAYNNEPVIVLEEFRSQLTLSLMLNLLDIYPFRLPARYNDKMACYTTVYIASNWSIEQQYRDIQQLHPLSWQAFLRRIHKVWNFDKEPPLPKDIELPF